MNTTHTPAEWAARNAEMLKDAWAEGDHLRTINADLVAALDDLEMLASNALGIGDGRPLTFGLSDRPLGKSIIAARAALARARGTA